MTNSSPLPAGRAEAETIVGYLVPGGINAGAAYVLFYALLRVLPYATALDGRLRGRHRLL